MNQPFVLWKAEGQGKEEESSQEGGGAGGRRGGPAAALAAVEKAFLVVVRARPGIEWHGAVFVRERARHEPDGSDLAATKLFPPQTAWILSP